MVNTPTCLHFNTLGTNNIGFSFMWQQVENATGYELEVCFAESFEDALRGLCWDSLDCEEDSWQKISEARMSWNEWEALCAKGRNWASWENAWLSWAAFEGKTLSWRDIETEPISFLVYKGNGDRISKGPEGYRWDSLDARFLIWNQLDAKENTWNQWDDTPTDSGFHVLASLAHLAGYGRWAWLHLRAYNQAGEYSAWFETGRQLVRQYRNNMAYGDMNKTGPLQLNADGAGQITGEDYVVAYGPNDMRTVKREWNELHDLKAQPQIISVVNGKLRFKCEKTIPPGQSWSGVLAAFPYYFESAANGSLVQMDILKDGTIIN